MARFYAAILLCLILALPCLAKPGMAASSDDGIWPFPPPDPKSWWDDPRPAPPEAADPLGGRRLSRGERPADIESGVEATTYRLWGLPPLQTQVLRTGEMIVEVWVRPSRSVRQSVIRIVVRRDGKAFVQARAGLACCEPGIARRVGFDTETDPAPFGPLRDLDLWNTPRDVRVAEAGGAADALCVDGVSYDLTLLVPGRARSVRRACDYAEIGHAADVLAPVLAAALGHEPRFDVLFASGADFATARRAYQDLIAQGGALKPARQSRAEPEAIEEPAQPQIRP